MTNTIVICLTLLIVAVTFAAWDGLRRWIDSQRAVLLAQDRSLELRRAIEALDVDRKQIRGELETRYSALAKENDARRAELVELSEQLEAAHKRNVEQFSEDDKALNELVKRIQKVESEFVTQALVVKEMNTNLIKLSNGGGARRGAFP